MYNLCFNLALIVAEVCHKVAPQFTTVQDQLKQLESLVPANSYYK